MKIIFQIFMLLLPSLLFSCVGKNNNREYYKLNNDSEYDIYLKIEKEGVYIFDEMYNLEFIINGNNTVERMYGDLLFFINTNWYTWSLYNYKTKDYMEGEEIGKIIEFSYSGDTGTEEIDLFYHSIIENYNFEIRNNNEHKLKLFGKRIFIDTRDFVDVSYDKRHNIFIICVYSSAGR